MFSAYSQISLSLDGKEMNHELNFYIASGSSETLTKFPGVQELIQGFAPHACSLGKQQGNEAGAETCCLSGSHPMPMICFWKSRS